MKGEFFASFLSDMKEEILASCLNDTKAEFLVGALVPSVILKQNSLLAP